MKDGSTSSVQSQGESRERIKKERGQGRGGRRRHRAGGGRSVRAPQKIFSQKGGLLVQEELERVAARRVKVWGKPEKEDYDFRSWTSGASKEWLCAGCVYENTRESWRLRCLLVLINAALEKVHGLEFLSLSFEGLRYRDALLRLGGWFGWLRSFTEELADNRRFADLGKERVKESLERLPRYFLAPGAIGLAMPLDLVEPLFLWPEQPLMQNARGIVDGSMENIAVQIRWVDYNNEEMGQEMAAVAEKLRPASVPEPQRRGKGKKSEIESLLDALSVLRICNRFPLACDLSRRIVEVAGVCGYSGCKKEARAYKARCKAGRGDLPMSIAAQVEIARARDRALLFFQQLFPWEIPKEMVK
jgi:hypothetical protein